MPPATPHRVASPGSLVLAIRQNRRPSRVLLSPSDSQDNSPSPAINNSPRRPMRADRHLAAEGPATDMQTQPQWQQNHLIDLHQQLQAWACELDAREATLTAYSAVDDHRRRQICLRKLRRESQQASPPRLS